MSAAVEKVAEAVLYEGYLLYPYRPTALKNRQRFNFGVIEPAGPAMQTECLVTGGPLALFSVKVRCLRLLSHPSGQEASECEMYPPEFYLGELSAPLRRRFSYPAARIADGDIVRTAEPLDCEIEIALEPLRDGLTRIRVRISNLTPPTGADRDSRLVRSILSAHTILRVQSGEFVSLLEPPPEFAEAAAACSNQSTWPVLAGEPGSHDTMLSSPIILYDYPQIAPESPGDLFDCAEIDEILSLRILTLTDDEKDAMRAAGDRARLILERTESLPPEHFLKLHGVLRKGGS